VEAIILAGGKAERLGDAARGRPKALVPVAGEPLAAYQVVQLVAAGVTRVLVSCRAGQEDTFSEALDGLGAEVVPVGEPEPLGRGGGLRFAAAKRSEEGPVFALNGDELLDLDLGAVLALHVDRSPAATIVVAPMVSTLGVVDVGGDDRITGFREAPPLPYWVNVGCYVLDGPALERLPERGDHERTTFPQLAEAGQLLAYRHEGLWLTVNTPKDLRRAEEAVAERPEWQPRREALRARS
jgi:NDP-sugar pyrophosphorylase family protein